MTRIRPATSDDALSLGALATQVFLDTYAQEGIRPSLAEEVRRSFSFDALQSVLAQPGVVICVAEFKAHLIGFAQVTLRASQALVQATRPAELDRLYLQRPFLGQGVGGQLLHAAQELAAKHGANALWCTVWAHNIRALRFYQRQGYVDLGASVFVMDRERHDNRVLCKTL